MMISEGSGMQALSIPIVNIIPKYPIWEITLIIHLPIGSSMVSNKVLGLRFKVLGFL
jgi:hypothetical protein